MGGGLAVSGMAYPSSVAAVSRVSASDKIRFGILGLGGRNLFLIQEFLKNPEVEIAYICDVDKRRWQGGFDAVSGKENFGYTHTSASRYEPGYTARKGQEKKPEAVQDFRRMLDDPDVDALVISPGSHWGPLATIMACQAGKDVYLEKPFSHDIYEGRKTIEAARKYGRVVQIGSQNRSAPYIKNAVDYIRSGKLGEVRYVRVLNMLDGQRGAPGPYPAKPVPTEFDYDMWCGPAPKRAYNPKKTAPGVWRYFWEYSGSDSESIHQVDVARWVVGQAYPRSVHSVGRVSFPDRLADLPDTLSTIYDYGDVTLSFDLTWWTPYMIKSPRETVRHGDQFPHWPLNGTRIEIYGREGTMMLGRHGGGWQVWGPDGEEGPSEYGRMAVPEHIQDFLNCIKSRKKPNADIEVAQYSQAIIHMAYISYRLGNRQLNFDGASERFIGDDEANQYIGRPNRGRAPWKIPKEV